MPIQPCAIVAEVLADRTHQKWVQSKRGQSEADVGRDTTAPDLQILDQKRQRDPIELFGEQRFREPAGELHQVVHGYRASDRDTHEVRVMALSRRVASVSANHT